MKLYKITGPGGQAVYGGKGKWHLPQRGKPGKWMPKIKGDLVPCENGYHLCRRGDLIHWIGSGAVWEAEHRGEVVKSDNKVVVREARLVRRLVWDDRIARHFACDCAEHVLPLFEAACPGDDCVRKCIEAARKFADGALPASALDAAWAAAWAAARDAARGAARNAARDAAWAAAWAAARDAARDAARNAARAAAWAAAMAAERRWQTTRLFQYLEGRRTP